MTTVPESAAFNPKIHMPEAEAEALREAYRAALVIGEYGAGGSTAFAATECTARVLSIESDREWVQKLQEWIDLHATDADRITVQHCDIGPTGPWGRPANMAKWTSFWTYPFALWQDPGFDPDLVLIDGRFRTACLAACMMHCRKPLTVLFDDYADRAYYHHVEKIIPRAALNGRLARFEVVPGQIAPQDFAAILPWFFTAR
ncbi:hypothetical protein [Paracoccus xiamenensis]|uniref:hypothetical protein n=1 Tax=Paracoccus xiamenensis TaxID=2714901 RepID=UPI00140A4A69|nr:hypothetical protein [Paracoccus xiamenensis]NHF71866.1 hypothetical protein [Paracoccus xiamenensis]